MSKDAKGTVPNGGYVVGAIGSTNFGMPTGANGGTDFDVIYDESGFSIGTAGHLKQTIFLNETNYSSVPQYKYAEGKIINDLKTYIDKTYSQHYKTKDEDIQCFDAWIALGDATPTFRNTALKYLWRYGKKNGNNKSDLLKALHYIILCLYNDHYKG